MLSNPKMLEVNTRVWMKRFGPRIILSNIPDDYIERLSSLGIEILWLMGVWKTSKKLVEKCCFGSDLIAEYTKALDDWKREDVIGSPFAIDDYVLNPEFGSEEDLLIFKEKLNQKGIKLFVDFVPNHFGADSTIINSNPEIFLQTDYESFVKDPYTFYEYTNSKSIYIAHGRDPFFPPWEDTAQLNFFEERTRQFLIEKLEYISSIADGVRCDMAMLPLNNVFQNTWSGPLSKSGYKKPSIEFWQEAIKKIKQKKKDFIFLAEAYWDLEKELQKLGFDFTYDKTLMDKLINHDIPAIRAHLNSDHEFQIKSVRFIENHDEARAAKKLGIPASLAAAVVISTILGVRFYYDGQIEGKKIKLPVQLRREPLEKVSREISGFYNKLLIITKNEIFKLGNWHLLFPQTAGSGDNTEENILAWQWQLGNEFRIVVINYSGIVSRCRLKLDMTTRENKIRFEDLLTSKIYQRSAEEIRNQGLFIELKEFQSHIFAVKLNQNN
jgi:hypothetical protein